ncbi:hypothetical protein WICMUC_005328 [Wickerhamomyces mucosus]|uniref:Vacuolar protein-sorting-associated protein 24 n=1 Tax=Wickerhamomyces mucosus TaxID=1378264 RepID=A0A9P8P9D5_9ASCO|nr:hypothetical protein WICMUC_005328 [Wickerhamomyces mucosus]
MDYIKKVIWGPDPKEQHRKCKSLIRKNNRSLEKSIKDLIQIDQKTSNLIKQNYKKNNQQNVRLFAKELYNIKKQTNRLYKSKAQLESIGMQIDESFSMIKLQQSIGKSTIIMKEINRLIKLPIITGTMQELEKELVKSGIINEMTNDMIDQFDNSLEDEDEELEIDEEINKIITNLTTDKLNKIDTLPTDQILDNEPIKSKQEEEEEEDEDELVLNEMRERLKALQS